MVPPRSAELFWRPCMRSRFLLLFWALSVSAEGPFPGELLAGFEWRDVGPMRGGRSFAVAGHSSQPDTFYSGSVGGGVWKTQNAGRTWFPISDQSIPIGSIGAIAVAPSNPDIVYVGTGESDIRSQNSYGNGMYKSIDAGKTWTHIGLDSIYQTARVSFPPPTPTLFYAAAPENISGPTPVGGVSPPGKGGK